MLDDIYIKDCNNIDSSQTKSIKNFNQQITNEFNQNVEIIEKELFQLKALLFLNEMVLN
jgi:hypothetical protein